MKPREFPPTHINPTLYFHASKKKKNLALVSNCKHKHSDCRKCWQIWCFMCINSVLHKEVLCFEPLVARGTGCKPILSFLWSDGPLQWRRKRISLGHFAFWNSRVSSRVIYTEQWTISWKMRSNEEGRGDAVKLNWEKLQQRQKHRDADCMDFSGNCHCWMDFSVPTLSAPCFIRINSL